MDPLTVGPIGGSLVFEQAWAQLRHAVMVVGWVILVGLIAAASCWCCGYVARSDLTRPGSPGRHRRTGAGDVAPIVLDDDLVVAEAERGIREIETFLSTV